MKKVLRILLVLVVLLVVAVVVGLFYIDSIAKTAIEEGGTYAMGVKTTLDSISIKLFQGQLKMDGLKIANPEGFEKSDHLMSSGLFDVGLTPSSVLEDTVILPKFILDGLDVNIESKSGGSNISVILANLEKLGGGEEEKPKEEEGEGKKVKIEVFLIKNVTAHFYMPLGSVPLTVKVPEIDLSEFMSDNPNGVVMPELMRRIIPIILASIAENAKGIVPADFLKDMDGQIGAVAKAIGGNMENVVKGVQEASAKAMKDAADALQKGVGDSLKKGTEDAKGALDGLLGGKKKGEDEKTEEVEKKVEDETKKVEEKAGGVVDDAKGALDGLFKKKSDE